MTPDVGSQVQNTLRLQFIKCQLSHGHGEVEGIRSYPSGVGWLFYVNYPLVHDKRSHPLKLPHKLNDATYLPSRLPNLPRGVLQVMGRIEQQTRVPSKTTCSNISD